MEVNAEKAQAAKTCFAFNPIINTVFVSGDLACFADRGAAVNHARGLQDKEIDVFIRDEDEPVADADQSNSATDESYTIPNFKTAQTLKFSTPVIGAAFDKAPAPVPQAPVNVAEYQAAKDQFTELYKKWNTLTADEQSAPDGVTLSDQLSALHALITQYESTSAPVDAAPVDAAPVDAAPVDAAPVDAAPVDAAPVDAAPVDAAPVDAAPVDENITEKLTELVDGIENLLHIKKD